MAWLFQEFTEFDFKDITSLATTYFFNAMFVQHVAVAPCHVAHVRSANNYICIGRRGQIFKFYFGRSGHESFEI